MTRPTTDPYDWASDTNFASGDEIGNATKDLPTAGEAAQGFVPGIEFPSQWINEVLQNTKLWLSYLEDESKLGIYGDASDGDRQTSVDGNIPSRITYYNDLTIDDSQTPTYPIFVAGTLTITAAGTIDRSGGDGGNASGGTGGSAGAAPSAGKLGTGAAGGAGGNSGANGTAGTTAGTNAVGGAGGAGGDDDPTTPTFTGGAGGTAAVAPSSNYRGMEAATSGVVIQGTSSPSIVRLAGGAGGGGGAHRGGGGGAGGAVAVIVARQVVLEGTIDASGGDGGDGESGTSGGGGGGGGGGGVYIVTRLRTGAGTITVAGGTGGTGNAGTNDENGEDGSDGIIVELLA